MAALGNTFSTLHGMCWDLTKNFVINLIIWNKIIIQCVDFIYLANVLLYYFNIKLDVIVPCTLLWSNIWYFLIVKYLWRTFGIIKFTID